MTLGPVVDADPVGKGVILSFSLRSAFIFMCRWVVLIFRDLITLVSCFLLYQGRWTLYIGLKVAHRLFYRITIDVKILIYDTFISNRISQRQQKLSSPSNLQHHKLAMFKNVQIPESSPLNVAGAAYLVSPLMFNVFTFNDHCYICSCQRRLNMLLKSRTSALASLWSPRPRSIFML